MLRLSIRKALLIAGFAFSLGFLVVHLRSDVDANASAQAVRDVFGGGE